MTRKCCECVVHESKVRTGLHMCNLRSLCFCCVQLASGSSELTTAIPFLLFVLRTPDRLLYHLSMDFLFVQLDSVGMETKL